MEQIGQYNPMTDPPTTAVSEDRARHWLSNGAKPSEAVERILQAHGILEKAKS